MNNEINHNPANDFPLGPIGADTVHDTEGHVWQRESGSDENGQGDEVAPEVTDDTEGHGLRR